MIYGLVGRWDDGTSAGAGKDSFYSLMEPCWGGAMRRVAFADPLKEARQGLLGVDVRRPKDYVDPVTGLRVRLLDQTMGDACRDYFGRDIFIRLALHKALSYKDRGIYTFITDVRYDNEAEAIRDAGGRIICIHRTGQSPNGDIGSHSSERGVSDHLIDEVVENEGDLDAYRETVKAWALRNL